MAVILKSHLFATLAGAMLVAVSVSAATTMPRSECILGPRECTCSKQPPSGLCTRPSADGKCLQGACTKESYRCDCWGFEKCAISTCGQHRPDTSAIPSADVEFRCTYVADAGQCRNVAGFMDSVESSDNARDSSIVFVDESVVEEREIINELATTLNYKLQVLDAMRAVDRRGDLVTEADLADVTAEAETVVTAVHGMMEDLHVAVNESREAFEAMKEAKLHRRGAHKKEKLAEVEEAKEREAKETADAAHAECATCAALKAQIREIRGERRHLAQLAGTWAAKARGNKEVCKAKREAAQVKQLTAEEAKTRCIAKSTAVLQRLLMASP
jgi:hypothetical protein